MTDRLPVKKLAFVGMFMALLAAGSVKIWILTTGHVPFNADEAIVALMARHILAGDRPLFFYGQAYLGSLDAALIALGFKWFGQQVAVIRAVQGLLYLATIASVGLLGRDLFSKWQYGLLAAWLLAVPTVNVSLYTTATLGGYGEAMLIGTWLLILAVRSWKQYPYPAQQKLWLAWGLLAGFGVWVFGLTLMFSLPAGLFMCVQGWEKYRRRVLPLLGLGILGGLLGMLPLMIGALQLGVTEIAGELGGSAIAGVAGLGFFRQTWVHLVSFLLLGTTVISGIRAPWSVELLVPWLAPIALIYFFLVLAYLVWMLRSGHTHRTQAGLLASVGMAVTLGFIVTPFGADPSGRYFLPLAIPIALLGGVVLIRLWQLNRMAAAGLFIGILAFNLAATAEVVQTADPGVTTQFYAPSQVDQRQLPALVHFLEQQGETCGYSNYWVAYPLAFLSAEGLIYVPELPYHLDFRYTVRDNRYDPYQEHVANCEQVAYITTFHEPLNQALRTGFNQLGVNWQEATIGDYVIFYGLSEHIRPDQILSLK
jgi:hypothetical protein